MGFIREYKDATWQATLLKGKTDGSKAIGIAKIENGKVVSSIATVQFDSSEDDKRYNVSFNDALYNACLMASGPDMLRIIAEIAKAKPRNVEAMEHIRDRAILFLERLNSFNSSDTLSNISKIEEKRVEETETKVSEQDKNKTISN